MRLQSFIAFAATAAVSLSLPCAALAQQPQHTYTARQIFAGAFFGIGPLAANRPALRAIAVPSSGETSARALQAIEDGVQRFDASYFREIGPQLTSGDPVIVQAAVARTQADLGRVAAATRSQRAHDMAFVNPGGGDVIVYINAMIDVVNNMSFIIMGTTSLHPATRYQTEQAVALLTSQLANVSVAG